MAIVNLEKILRPKSVAVIGASAQPRKVGYTVLKNIISSGFAGEVYAVNPKHEVLEGCQVFSTVGELPQGIDLAVICTPAATVPHLVRRCGEVGIRGVLIVSAGFREAGLKGEALEEELRREASRFEGMRILGPNCLGVIAPASSLNASFAQGMPKKGRVAFISQSGALCTSVLDWALAENIGFSYFVSVGNMLDVGIGDLIDFFSIDEHTDAIIMYVESISEPREFLSAARAFARRKPLIAYKAGRFAESAQAAASHTGAMAGVDDVYQAAFDRAGIVRVFAMDDMFDCAEILARSKMPKGARLAIVTNAGGPGVMATDALLERKGTLAILSEETKAALDEVLPKAWSHRNPVDMLGDATPERLSHALRITLNDPGVDAALVIFVPQAITDPRDAAQAVIEVAASSNKPLLTAWMGGVSMKAGIDALNAASIPTYATPEKAIGAFMHLVTYARNRAVLYETPRDLPVEFPLDRGKLRAVFNTILSEGEEILTESTSKALLEAYEIPVTRPYLAWTRNDAVTLARRIGYPVVMKVLSHQISHKTEVEGVQLNLASDKEVEQAFDHILRVAKERRPDAEIKGVTIQPMVTIPASTELIVGAKRDAVFGSVLMVGMGGIATELFRDRALGLPPLNERLARWMLESLHAWPLLKGFRGRPGANVDKLIEVLMRLSYLIADYPEVKELDVNPLLVTPTDVIALDARIVLDREALLTPPRPHSHLAICPYPDQYVRRVRLKDGTPLLLRPIKPEDEPMWHEMLKQCSPESIWFRFRYSFKSTTHEMASRFCYIDYDREIAIVAETEEQGKRRLAGVGRLVADIDHRDADYGVLVADAFQGRGLGSLLMDYCISICRDWGIEQVTVETTPDNLRMISLIQNRGFAIDRSVSHDVVLGRKVLGSRKPRRVSAGEDASVGATESSVSAAVPQAGGR